jgi:hypothetical protein
LLAVVVVVGGGGRLMGKVAADNSHKWVYREPMEHEISFISPWHGSLDPVSHFPPHSQALFLPICSSHCFVTHGYVTICRSLLVTAGNVAEYEDKYPLLETADDADWCA